MEHEKAKKMASKALHAKMGKKKLDITSPSERANNVAIGKSIIRAGKKETVAEKRKLGRCKLCDTGGHSDMSKKHISY